MFDEHALSRRFSELADRAETRHTLVYSDFLNMNEQSVLQNMRLRTPFVLWGGYGSAERKVACFGTTEQTEATKYAPFVLLKIAPVAPKFADALTHRDFLGSILALGLRREIVGDILLCDNCGYAFCMDTVADFLTEHLDRVRRTTVQVSETDSLPEVLDAEPETQSLVVASPRLDALLAAAFRLSRSEAQRLIAAERVFVDSRAVTRADILLQENCFVSARGFGRFRYCGTKRETKKGKLRVSVQIYK